MSAAVPSPRRSARMAGQEGVALLGVLLLVAAALVAAAAVGVLLLRQMDVQRKVDTQARLKAAFTGIFGGPSLRGASMYKDFAYNPSQPATPPVVGDLAAMVVRSAVGSTDPANASVPQFDGTQFPPTRYWNGPYWAGSVDASSRPVDAWGRPLQLRYISTGSPTGWQVYSLGANGRDDTGTAGTPAGDDLVYPIPPYQVPSSTFGVASFTMIISVAALGPGNNHSINVYVTDATGVERHISPFNVQLHSNGSGGKGTTSNWTTSLSVASPPGTVSIRITDSGTNVSGWPKTYAISNTSPQTLTINLP